MAALTAAGAVGRNDVTHLLDAWSAGDSAALGQVMPLVIDDLRRLARSHMARQTPGHTLQPTALIHEAYLRLVGQRTLPWRNRTQFFAYVASTMRRILINHVRDREVEKRGGQATCVPLDDVFGIAEGGGSSSGALDLLDLDRALQSLAEVDSRQGRIVELRYFGGLTIDETAEVLGVSPRTVKREWHSARLWLLRALGA